MNNSIIWFALGTLLGAVLTWVISKLLSRRGNKSYQREIDQLKNNLNESAVENAKYTERVENLEVNRKELKENIEAKEGALADSLRELSKVQTDNRHLTEKLENQKTELEEIQKKFTTEFENLAAKILEEKSKKFTESNKENIDRILKPLNENIKDFQKRVEETYDKESKQRFSLEKEIKRLYELNEQVTKEANNLTRALKGESKTQGNWGEMILETILEKSGLIKGTHFSVQQSITSGEGRLRRPDVVINLPEDKNMVVDSKVSLTAYERFYSTDDKKEKETALSQHIASIKNHIKELSDKNYQSLYGIKSPDFVLMFIPIEPAFGIAVMNDSNLFYEAFNKNIVIVSPSTLLATLRTIGSIWRFEIQNKNALKIADQGGKLYDKFVAFVEDLQDIGKKIKDTRKSYDNACNKLIAGRGNLIKKAEDIRKLGAKASKRLPESVVEDSEGIETPLIENNQE